MGVECAGDAGVLLTRVCVIKCSTFTEAAQARCQDGAGTRAGRRSRLGVLGVKHALELSTSVGHDEELEFFFAALLLQPAVVSQHSQQGFPARSLERRQRLAPRWLPQVILATGRGCVSAHISA
jgi:hypothetical protein